MPRSGPRKIQKYSTEFKVTAVKLSQQAGLQVQVVAHALEIHPFMLSKWRKDFRDGRLRGQSRVVAPRGLPRRSSVAVPSSAYPHSLQRIDRPRDSAMRHPKPLRLLVAAGDALPGLRSHLPDGAPLPGSGSLSSTSARARLRWFFPLRCRDACDHRVGNKSSKQRPDDSCSTSSSGTPSRWTPRCANGFGQRGTPLPTPFGHVRAPGVERNQESFTKPPTRP